MHRLQACNYDDSASVDDGSCEYPEFSCRVRRNMLVDEDEDGVCDCENSLDAPTESVQLRSIYTDDAGNCYYAEEFYDCAGNCLCDEDGDGVCVANWKSLAAQILISATTILTPRRMMAVVGRRIKSTTSVLARLRWLAERPSWATTRNARRWMTPQDAPRLSPTIQRQGCGIHLSEREVKLWCRHATQERRWTPTSAFMKVDATI